MDYIKVDEAFAAIVVIPESSSGDTVTYTITLGSDKSTFASGSMTFVAGHAWKCSFTPDSEDDFILEANNQTLIIKHTLSFKSTGEGITAPVSPAGNDLTALATFKTNFNISTDTHDTLITNTITQISEYIQSKPEINQYFIAASYTEYYNGDGDVILILRKLPVNSITSIYDDLDRTFDETEDQIDSSNYSVDSESGILQFDGAVMCKGVQNIRVIYNAGYNAVPANVQIACEKLVMADYIEKVTGVNTGIGDDQIYKPDKLRKDAWRILEAYFKS